MTAKARVSTPYPSTCLPARRYDFAAAAVIARQLVDLDLSVPNEPGCLLVDTQYSGSKSELRPIYTALVSAVTQFGDDVQISPKKASVSLKRSKQFALIEPASATRIQLGNILRDATPTLRLIAATGMCTHKVSLFSTADVDDELLIWLQSAYDIA